MDNYKKEVMDTIIRLRMSKSDYLLIKQRAKNNYLTVSEYLRRRGVEDPDATDNQQIAQADNKEGLSKARFACDHDKQMMFLVYRSYLYSKEMAKKEFGQKWFDDSEKVATLLMKEWGYE